MLRTLIAVLCVFSLCFVFVGCGEKENPDAGSSAVTYYDGESEIVVQKDDVAAKVQSGTLTFDYDTIDEAPATATVQLTMSSDALKAALPESDLIRNEKNNYIQYACGGADFYYTNDDQNHGLAAIACFGTAYGFEPTVTTKDDITSVLGSPTASGDAPEAARSLLLRQATGFTYIDYTFGTNHVSFFFYENSLSLTVIYQQGLWIY